MENLKSRIKALEDAGLDATDERAALAKLGGEKVEEKSAVPRAPRGVESPGAKVAEAVPFDIEVDLDSFESGGQAFGAPTDPGIYQGVFQDIITPITKTEQRWFIFKTNDPRVEKQVGQQVRSALIVSPLGMGAFKLKDILDSLGIPYTIEDNRVIGAILRELACELDYQEVTLEGKTQNRLQNVYAAGSIEKAI